MPFHAHFSRDEVSIRGELAIKYITSWIIDAHQTDQIRQYALEYGIIDWAWPLRFVKGNSEYKGFKYYSRDARQAVLKGETKFTRDHYLPKNLLKKILLDLSNPDATSIKRIMETYGDVCVITRDEDRSLNKAGLKRGMPTGWQTGDDRFARYKEVGIEVWENDLLW
jgi:hypothetical protein